MVLITPRLVRPLNPDEVPPLPTRPRRFLPAPEPERRRRGVSGGGGTVDAPSKTSAKKAAKAKN